ncbi:MAG: hypothetical protein P1U68_12565 [Verrucomicrobiales bacterium]|nr:hypothetical protein [Verrucomicrobiales bacterium]
MSKIELKDLVSLIPGLELNELRALEMSVKVAIDIRTQGQLSTETSLPPRAADEGPGLNDQALAILEGVDTFELSLADQALLGALVLSEGYHQDVFSSRDVNDIIEECGRPRIAHITSAISGLTDRAYLTGSTKALSMSKEGRAKARGLIGMVRRKAA